MKKLHQILLLSCLLCNISFVKPFHDCYFFTINQETEFAETEYKYKNESNSNIVSTNENMIPIDKSILKYVKKLLAKAETKANAKEALTKPEVMAIPLLKKIINERRIDLNTLKVIQESKQYKEIKKIEETERKKHLNKVKDNTKWELITLDNIAINTSKTFTLNEDSLVKKTTVSLSKEDIQYAMQLQTKQNRFKFTSLALTRYK